MSFIINKIFGSGSGGQSGDTGSVTKKEIEVVEVVSVNIKNTAVNGLENGQDLNHSNNGNISNNNKSKNYSHSNDSNGENQMSRLSIQNGTSNTSKPKRAFGPGCHRNSASNRSRLSTDSDTSEVGTDNYKEHVVQEYFNQVGIITRLDEYRGIISKLHEFVPSEFKHAKEPFKLGDMVRFNSKLLVNDLNPKVTKMAHYVSEDELALQELKEYCLKQVQIIEFDEAGNAKVSAGSHGGTFHIENSLLPRDYESFTGDKLTVKMKIEERNEDTDEYNGKILEVNPTKTRQFTAARLLRINDVDANDILWIAETKHVKIFVPETLVAGNVCVKHGDDVNVEVVESNCNGLSYDWRAISIEPSKHKNPSGYRTDVDENISANAEELNDYLISLTMDKEGILINDNGKETNFGEVFINSRSIKSIVLKNTTTTPYTLHTLKMQTGDSSVAEFKVLDKPEHAAFFKVIDAEGSLTVRVQVKPKIIGKTVEYLVFDFGSFSIGRKLQVQCVSRENLGKANQKREPEMRNNNRKQMRQDFNDCVDSKKQWAEKTIIPSNYHTVRNAFFVQKMKKVGPYPIPPNVRTAYAENLADILFQEFPSLTFKSFNDMKKKNGNMVLDLTPENYKDCFHVGLWLEEIELENQYEKLVTNDCKLFRQSDDSMCITSLKNRNLDFSRIQLGSKIVVSDPKDEKKQAFKADISRIDDDKIYARFNEALMRTYKDQPMTVKFEVPRNTFRRWHHAVEIALDILGKDWLFPTQVEARIHRLTVLEEVISTNTCSNYEELDVDYAEVEKHTKNSTSSESGADSAEIGTNSDLSDEEKSDIAKVVPVKLTKTQRRLGKRSKKELDKRIESVFPRQVREPEPQMEEIIGAEVKLKWYNEKLNPEQKTAVRRILRGQCRPLPFIIYGPPGTGKTVTLVEAVLQIHTLMRTSRILVTAPTNAAADLITEYLVSSGKFIPGQMIRLLAYSRKLEMVPDKIQEYCMDPDPVHMNNDVIKCPVLVTTTTTAAQLADYTITEGHYSHVFIDEAGCCTEPDGLIPSLFINTGTQGQLILAGDNRQLGPIVQSHNARFYGLGVSFLERLLSTELYKNENQLLVAKLVRNYRTSEQIIRMASNLFYNNELIAEAPKDETENLLFMLRDFLPRSEIPIMFFGLDSDEYRDRDSSSWYNEGEIDVVIRLLTELLQSGGVCPKDVGIITPYRKQVEKIKAAIETKVKCEVPKIGSVEAFQGDEKKIIILSLVRSRADDAIPASTSKLTFVFSDKRTNVSITRARCLQIIIGNPNLFYHNPNWKQIINYCVKLGVYKGCHLPAECNPAIKADLYTERQRRNNQNINELDPKHQTWD